MAPNAPGAPNQGPPDRPMGRVSAADLFYGPRCFTVRRSPLRGKTGELVLASMGRIGRPI